MALNILITEDNPADAKITLRAFEKSAIKNNLFLVTKPDEVFDFICNRARFQDSEKFPKPDIILLDIKMPARDGFGVLKQLKDYAESESIPVIMLTSSKDENDIIQSYKNGAAGYIQKDVDFNRFCEIIDTFNKYWHTVSRLPAADNHRF